MLTEEEGRLHDWLSTAHSIFLEPYYIQVRVASQKVDESVTSIMVPVRAPHEVFAAAWDADRPTRACWGRPQGQGDHRACWGRPQGQGAGVSASVFGENAELCQRRFLNARRTT